ncbi:MAG: hypothetical protein IIV04_05130, partial [Bacteroidaceae bacterium]|nr:hypothetical protein [Bacteroidaceae bacterium]
WSGAEYDIEPNFVKVADGVITPLELTMAEFCADIKALQDAIWGHGISMHSHCLKRDFQMLAPDM